MSPWYKIEEAAAYCGMARSTFEEKATSGGLPRGGDGCNKRYRADDLDRFIANGFCYPGMEQTVAEGNDRQRRINRRTPGEEQQQHGVVNPNTGKIWSATRRVTTQKGG